MIEALSLRYSLTEDLKCNLKTEILEKLPTSLYGVAWLLKIAYIIPVDFSTFAMFHVLFFRKSIANHFCHMTWTKDDMNFSFSCWIKNIWFEAGDIKIGTKNFHHCGIRS